MTKQLPFSFLPTDIARQLAAVFGYQAESMSKFMPNFKTTLLQADLELSVKDYLAITFLSGTIFSVISFVLVLAVGLITAPVNTAIVSALLIAVTVFFSVFVYAMLYPRMLIQSKTKLLERDLLFALKYILIRIKSGICLYDAMVGVAQGNYGEVSNEFRKAIKEIATGTEEVVALENMALRVPSTFFRRTIWQITNNLRAGSDIAKILEAITSTLVREQRILIRQYGSELNPIILMYMMFAIIIPSLGITVMIVMSSLSGLAVPMFVFYLIPIGVFAVQLIFTRVIKDKKPMLSVMGE